MMKNKVKSSLVVKEYHALQFISSERIPCFTCFLQKQKLKTFALW